ncbi:hypothetical protein FB45DRAFT_1039897 [Roridomyces roridus]|uniref:DUF6534 domain-containing protein n=1 Tax=Roridomyces roridus TaxID=1738132 RepID=A0AAD7B1Z2_9AGAR|nr:hypothetical protein FB45DRAFT_1039897 [Roridomyces roridus]
MSSLQSIHLTLGPLLAGSMSAAGLSAVVGFQTFLYFQIYPQDKMKYKLFVSWVWLVDAAHTLFICLTVWDYAILHFGDKEHLTVISFWYPAHLVMTLAATFSANMFYLWRIHKMSKGNWYLIVPILTMCIARIAFGLMLVYAELKYKLWATVYERFPVFPALAFIASAITDVVISIARYYYLRRLNQGYFQTKEVVDTVLVFTINDGLLTMAVFVMSCILAMHDNFVWTGIFFNLAKLFANSILATGVSLNLRNWYRQMHRPMGISLTREPHMRNTVQFERNCGHAVLTSPRAETMPQNADTGMLDESDVLEVQVNKQIEYHVEMDKYSGSTLDGVPKTFDLKI